MNADQMDSRTYLEGHVDGTVRMVKLRAFLPSLRSRIVGVMLCCARLHLALRLWSDWGLVKPFWKRPSSRQASYRLLSSRPNKPSSWLPAACAARR